MNKRFLSTVIFTFILSVGIFANPTEQFENANKAYQDGKYEEAIKLYSEIIDSGQESAALYYNLGNAYYKTYKYNHAILFYEKAKRLAPHDKDIASNLNLVVKYHVTDKIDVIEPFFLTRWSRAIQKSFPCDTWAYMSLSAFITMLLCAGIYLFSINRGIKKLTFFLAIILLLISISGFIYTKKEREYLQSHNEAIIFTPTVIIKSMPNEQGKELFTIHEGLKVNLLDSLDNFYEIRIDNGNVGWLLKSDVRKI